MLKNLFIVGMGGSLGAILRYLMSLWLTPQTATATLPYGTITVNFLGCFLIGFFATLAENKAWFSTEISLLLIIGFLGSLTTFSTFGNDSLNLMRQNAMAHALFNIGIQVMGGLILVWLGRIFCMKLFVS
jgi:fluoride exporter